ncbi:MAG: hypothetical protein JO279_01730, partial [Verrucomicrobia bacterium]|nr:hypothetical protein [Verrucomicrobiota bacterium]
MGAFNCPPLNASPGRGDGLPLDAPDWAEQEHPEEIDNIIPTHGYDMLPMVGLGGSAGAIS